MKAEQRLNQNNGSSGEASGATNPPEGTRESSPQIERSTLSFTGPNIRLQLEMHPGSPPVLDRVVIEALDDSESPVAEYRTVGPIHSKLGHDILRLCADITDGSKVVGAAQKIYHSLSTSSATSWETIPNARPQDSSLNSPSMYPITPTLQQLVSRPSVINEQFAAHKISSQGSVRLTALISPMDGILTITLRETSFDNDTDKVKSWRVLASNNVFASKKEVSTELLSIARYVAGSLNFGGFDEVVDLLDGGSIDALPLISDKGVRALSDWHIGQVTPDRSNVDEVTLRSGGSVTLEIGSEIAALSVKANSYDDSRKQNIVFDCPSNLKQLSAWQIHHIREIHRLLTSESLTENDRAMTMCLTPLAYLHELNNKKGSLTPGPGFLSLHQLKIRLWAPSPDLEGMLGREHATTLLSLPGVTVRIPKEASAGVLRNYLDGVRSVILDLTSQEECRRNPELFNSMRIGLCNDGRIRVVVMNQMNGGLATVLEPEESTDSSTPEETIVRLCELFAAQDTESWEPLFAYINDRSGAVAIEPSERVWDLGFWELPPEEDRSALAMYTEAGRIYSAIATGFHDAIPAATASYRGEGTVELAVARYLERPYFKFKLQNGMLREVVIYKNCTGSSPDAVEGERIAVFQSDTLEATSPVVRAMAESCSLAYHAYPSVVFGPLVPEKIDAINKALIEHFSLRMNRVL